MSSEQRLQESEQFSKTVLESSPDCLKILDNEGKLQFMNYNGLCLMEIDDFSDFRDQYWWSLWGKDNEKMVKDAVDKALSGEVANFSAFCATAKGTPKWWDVSVIPVGDKKFGILQLLSVSRDITQQINAQKQIEELNNELEKKVEERTKELEEKNNKLNQSIEDLTKFNYIASHDLQEPLRKIQTFIKLIQQENLEPSKEEQYFNRILVSAERMRTLIDALHIFSTVRNTELKLESCDLNHKIDEIEDSLAEQISFKNAKIIRGKLPKIKAAKPLLYQLLTNLIENALKYSREDTPPEIHIEAREVPYEEVSHYSAKKQDYFEIKVSDNGIGFKKEYEGKIFDLFQRLHHKNEYSGLGIGLTICKNIIQKHEGWIEASGEENIGATFKVYFPKK